MRKTTLFQPQQSLGSLSPLSANWEQRQIYLSAINDPVNTTPFCGSKGRSEDLCTAHAKCK